jgi:hypothetical protein
VSITIYYIVEVKNEGITDAGFIDYYVIKKKCRIVRKATN